MYTYIYVFFLDKTFGPSKTTAESGGPNRPVQALFILSNLSITACSAEASLTFDFTSVCCHYFIPLFPPSHHMAVTVKTL